MIDYLLTRNWDLYPFLPPIMALVAYIIIDPVHERLAESKLKEFLSSQGEHLAEAHPLISNIAQDYSLQVVWISTVISFLSSVVTISKHIPMALTVSLLAGIVIGIPITLDIFLRPPGYHSATKVGRLRFLSLLRKKDWSQFDAYGALMAVSNIVFIIILIIYLPGKSK